MITTVIAEVAGAYFNLLELDIELEIAKRTLAAREDSLMRTRARVLSCVTAGLCACACRGRGDDR